MASEEPVYKIHSMVRKVATRTLRAKSPSRHRFVQRLAGGDITVRRARAATVTESKIRLHIKELRAAVREGRIVVKTPTHQVVDILSDEFHLESSTPVASPAPKLQLDSAADDKTYEGGVGEDRPLFPGGVPQSQVAPSPSVNKPLGGSDEAPVVGAGDPAKLRAAQGAPPAEPEIEEAPVEAESEEAPDDATDSDPEAAKLTKAEKKAAKAAKKAGK